MQLEDRLRDARVIVNDLVGHRVFEHYCAGISRQHYKMLTDNSTPFVCLICTQLLIKLKCRRFKVR